MPKDKKSVAEQVAYCKDCPAYRNLLSACGVSRKGPVAQDIARAEMRQLAHKVGVPVAELTNDVVP